MQDKIDILVDRLRYMFFDEHTHRYFIKLNEPWFGDVNVKLAEWLVSKEEAVECISVTTLIKKYSEPFHAEEKSIELAEGKGTDPESLRASWNYSGDFGSLIHMYPENISKHIEPDEILDDREPAYRNAVDMFWNAEKMETAKLYPEIIIYDVERRVAGTIDMLAFFPDRTSILDWKTNERFRTRAYRDARLLPPFSHIPDCHMTKYSLQLNIYKQILYDTCEIDVNNMKLIHLMPDEYKPYVCYDMTRDAQFMLELAKNR